MKNLFLWIMVVGFFNAVRAGDFYFRIDELSWQGKKKRFSTPKIFEYKIDDEIKDIKIVKMKGTDVFFTCRIKKSYTSMGKSAEIVFMIFSKGFDTMYVNPGMSALAGGVLNGWGSAHERTAGICGFKGEFHVKIDKSEIYPELIWNEDKYKLQVHLSRLGLYNFPVYLDSLNITISDTTGKYSNFKKIGFIINSLKDSIKVGLLIYIKKCFESNEYGYKIYFTFYKKDSIWEEVPTSNEFIYLKKSDFELTPIIKRNITLKKSEKWSQFYGSLKMELME